MSSSINERMSPSNGGLWSAVAICHHVNATSALEHLVDMLPRDSNLLESGHNRAKARFIILSIVVLFIAKDIHKSRDVVIFQASL